ncbi:NAD(P)H-dependent oxidoreductase [Staphylococcus aureus]
MKRKYWILAEKPLNQLNFSGTTPSIDEIKQNMKDLKEKAMAADFLILGTPNYHGSYFWNIEKCIRSSKYGLFFKMKPVGLIGNSGGIVGSEPLSHLRVIVRSLLGIAVPFK